MKQQKKATAAFWMLIGGAVLILLGLILMGARAQALRQLGGICWVGGAVCAVAGCIMLRAENKKIQQNQQKEDDETKKW